ncbi:prolipoprotein diacylglyceryl transferase, partial [Lactobacillus crispatus]
LLFIVMAVSVRRLGFRKPGLLGGIFVLGYALARTFCEFFREPDRQLGLLFGDHFGPVGGGGAMGMAVRVPLMGGGLTYIVLAGTGRTRPRHPVATPAAEADRKAAVEA